MTKSEIEDIKKSIINCVNDLEEDDLMAFMFSSKKHNRQCQSFVGSSYTIIGLLDYWKNKTYEWASGQHNIKYGIDKDEHKN